MPRRREEIQWLYDRGIRRILSLERIPSYETAHRAILDLGIENRRILVPDWEPPTVEQAREILDLLQDSLETLTPLLVHCLAGIGRTGTVHALYLIEFENKPAAEAVRIAGVESRCQEEFVMGWAAGKGR